VSNSSPPRISNIKPPTRDAEATKASILEAAEHEFSRFGLQGARTESIAAQTGVSKAMIHYYFESKENLYREVIRLIVERRRVQMAGLNLDEREPLEALHTFLTDLLVELTRTPSMPSVLIYEGLQNQGKYYHEIAAPSLYDPLIRILERGVASGRFRADIIPRNTAINLMGMTVFFVCCRDNLRFLWPESPDLMQEENFRGHVETTVSMACKSVLI
jgi:AcrR family transcriptional regulator